MSSLLHPVPRHLAGRTVTPVAAGGASWSLTDLDEQVARACLHAALDAGTTCVDTAVAYTRAGEAHHNEQLIGAVLAERGAHAAVVVTKCGHHRLDDGTWGVDGRPQVLAEQVRGSLRALGGEALDVCLLHHPDPAVPLAESVGALADLQSAGLVRAIGVSNVDVDQLDEACSAGPVTVVQIRTSALDHETSYEPLVAECTRRGASVMGYSPLGGPGALLCHGRTAAPLLALARDWGRSPQQLLLTHLVHRNPRLVVVAGSTRPSSAASAAAAARAASSDQLAQLTSAVEALSRRTHAHPENGDLP